jgi:hypothetical protein
MGRVEGKVALVTGAAPSGAGRHRHDHERRDGYITGVALPVDAGCLVK